MLFSIGYELGEFVSESRKVFFDVTTIVLNASNEELVVFLELFYLVRREVSSERLRDDLVPLLEVLEQMRECVEDRNSDDLEIFLIEVLYEHENVESGLKVGPESNFGE